MTVSFVQEVAKDVTAGSTTTLTATLTVTPTAGHRLIARIAANSAVTSVTDSKGNTWTIDVAQTTATPDWALVSCVPATPLVVGDVVTATIATATSNHGIVIDEWSGITAFGASTALVGGVTTTRTTNPITVPAGAVVFGVWTTTSVDTTFAAGTGFTAFNTADLVMAGGTECLEGVYHVDSGLGGSYTPTATASSATQRGMSVYYKGAPPASTGKLRYAPPAQTSPTVLDLTATPGSYFQTLTAGVDYIINLAAATARTGVIEIDANGARSIKIIGGSWALNDASGGPYNYHIHVHNLTGWAFIEGQEADMTNTHADFLSISGGAIARPDVYFQNSRILNLTATDATNHADIFQPQGLVGNVYVDKITFSSNYQGFTISADSTGNAPAGGFVLSRINSWYSSANATNPITYHYWLNGADGTANHDHPPYPVLFDDVYCDIARGAGRAYAGISNVIFPSEFATGAGKAGGGTYSEGGTSIFASGEFIGARDSGDATYCTVPNPKMLVNGAVRSGSPRTTRPDVITDTDTFGSFVPAGIGTAYASPGYATNVIANTALRDPSSGALVTVAYADAALPLAVQEGFLRDLNYALVTGTTAPLATAEAFMRDTNYALVTVPFASASAPTAVTNGFLRDSTGAVVTVTSALATAPTTMVHGYLRDANYALVLA